MKMHPLTTRIGTFKGRKTVTAIGILMNDAIKLFWKSLGQSQGSGIALRMNIVESIRRVTSKTWQDKKNHITAGIEPLSTSSPSKHVNH